MRKQRLIGMSMLLGSGLGCTGMKRSMRARAIGVLRRSLTDHQRHYKTIQHILSEHCASDSHSHLSITSHTDLNVITVATKTYGI